jgi:DNA-directed RNA polymerase specialized sigma24 family protein
MGQEAFDEFYLREYPRVVGLLQGLLRSRLVAEELAQETFLVAYRDWGRVGGLDNPRAWVRRVALNQRGSFLRAYLASRPGSATRRSSTRTTPSSWPTTTPRSGRPSASFPPARRR